MADSHLQVNYDGSITNEKTQLLPNNKELKESALTQLFSRNNWVVESISNETSCLWKIIVRNKNSNLNLKLKVLFSSIRDELRQIDEFKTQFGGKIDFSNIESGWINLPLGAYLKNENAPVDKWIFAAFRIENINFLSNPSFRGVRTNGLQTAQSFGYIENDSCIIFRPEFIYHVVSRMKFFQDSRYINSEKELIVEVNSNRTNTLQQIVFGAPGTGKSHGINSNANISESNSIRTTFHPDSDYSSFVGCYKPTKKEKHSNLIPSDKLISEAKNISGVANQVKYLCDNADSLLNAANELNISLNKLIWESFGWHNETYFASFLELIQKERADFGSEITYEFCPQAFTNAYVNAWKNLEEPYYLIIEEINRGNCAQIFGDIFQLLDRDENGFSSYKITPDQDLAHYLRSQFKDSDIDDEDIKSGCKMQLPNNLHIWATMNTSDQSLFPIDSAFKRRWDWKYMPIDYTDLGHYISCEDKKYSWSDFLEKVNEHIEATTQSEDKKLGYWFLARKNHNEITTELFVSKVIFYLWNDIFKDFASAGNSIFKDEYSKFHKFFDYSGNVKSDVVKKFLDNLGVISTNAEDKNDKSDSEESGALKFSLNGSQPISQRRLAQAALEEYLKNHSNYTAQQVIDDWKPLSYVPNFIATESEYLAQVTKAPSWENRAAKITLSNEEVVYISLQGWVPDATWAFVNAINAKDWGINIKRAEA